MIPLHLRSQEITDRNHTATIVVEQDELQLFFDGARFAIASVRRDPETGRLHLYSDVDDANADYDSWGEAYTDHEDWAHSDLKQMNDRDAELDDDSPLP